MKAKSFLIQLWLQILAPAATQIIHHPMYPQRSRLISLRGRAPVQATLNHGTFNLLLQARNADLEKLIEVRIGDAKKL